MNEILFDVLLFVVIVCGTLFTSTLLPYLKNQIEGSKYEDLFNEIKTAIRAAEQRILGEKQGKAKKAQVLAYITHWMNAKHIKITEEQLDNLIEAAVYSMNNE